MGFIESLSTKEESGCQIKPSKVQIKPRKTQIKLSKPESKPSRPEIRHRKTQIKPSKPESKQPSSKPTLSCWPRSNTQRCWGTRRGWGPNWGSGPLFYSPNCRELEFSETGSQDRATLYVRTGAKRPFAPVHYP
jgi:hypothetical protein